MRIQNISGETRDVPALNKIVAADEIVDVPDELAPNFVSQTANWEAVKAPAKKGGE